MTRREKFLKLRARFIRRRERARSVNSKWGSRLVFGKTKRLAYVVVWSADGMQSPQSENPGPYSWNDFLTPGLPAVPFTVAEVGFQKPPHVAVSPPHQRPNQFVGSSADYPVVGYHRKAVQRWKRKPNRLSKEQRAVWLANNYAWREGYFPDWDPLQRHPTGADIDNGEPYYSGPFPHGLELL